MENVTFNFRREISLICTMARESCMGVLSQRTL